MGPSHASLLFLRLLLLNNKEEKINSAVPIPSKASSSLRKTSLGSHAVLALSSQMLRRIANARSAFVAMTCSRSNPPRPYSSRWWNCGGTLTTGQNVGQSLLRRQSWACFGGVFYQVEQSPPLPPPLPFMLVYTDHRVPCHAVHLPSIHLAIVITARRVEHHAEFARCDRLGHLRYDTILYPGGCGVGKFTGLPPVIILTCHCYLPKCRICLQNRSDGAHSHSPLPCWAKGAAWKSRERQLIAMGAQLRSPLLKMLLF